jgi:hypothetical protein
MAEGPDTLLSAQAARHGDNAARARLEHLRLENEIRAQSFAFGEQKQDVARRLRDFAPSSQGRLFDITRSNGRPLTRWLRKWCEIQNIAVYSISAEYDASNPSQDFKAMQVEVLP